MIEKIPFIICLRNTTEWFNMPIDLIEYPKGIWKNPNRTIKHAMDVWNKITNNGDYCEHRRKMKEIGMSNLCSLKNVSMIVDITNIDSNDFIKSISGLYKDYILIPIDDDDWLSPCIYDYLVNHKGYFRWKSTRFNTATGNCLVDTTMDMHPDSNSYGFSKSGIESINSNHRDEILKDHTKMFDFEKPNMINEVLSIYNFHCGSISYLTNSISKPIIKQKVPSTKEWNLNWADPLLEKVVDLTNCLYDRSNQNIKMV